ncbi:Uncharacterized protein DAT39_008108 [Clarias magur]|uniref:Uncharacterized protein n=1 Tax=Clarias magur TaxID=1594786 RepID=A0A8J4TUN0_CLAMG|nr:Uncharacterized protein DAT39_008108 [Clarias magur]
MPSMQTKCDAMHQAELLIVTEAPARCVLLCSSATWWKRHGLEGPRMTVGRSPVRPLQAKVNSLSSVCSSPASSEALRPSQRLQLPNENR